MEKKKFEKYEVIPNKCFIKGRNGSSTLRGWYWIEEESDWRVVSTLTAIVEDAKKIALDTYMEIHQLEKEGVVIRSTGELTIKFNDAAQAEYEDLMKKKGTSKWKVGYDSYISAINTWFIPFFDGVALKLVDEDKIEEYEAHFECELGCVPSKSVLQNHHAAFNRVFRRAKKQGWIKQVDFPKLSIKDKGRGATPRSNFSVVELIKLEKFMLGWRRDSKDLVARYNAKLLPCYVKLLTASGIRTGKEIESIKWKHVHLNHYNAATDNYYIRLDLPHRKTGNIKADDHILVSKDIEQYFESIKKLTNQTEPEDFVFCGLDGQKVKGFSALFADCLVDADMRYNSKGEGRALYSLRHHYATERIRNEGVKIEVLARHMANSPATLNAFYIEVESERNAEQLAPSSPKWEKAYKDPMKQLEDAGVFDVDDDDRKAKVAEIMALEGVSMDIKGEMMKAL